jgi:hypothetical protein
LEPSGEVVLCTAHGRSADTLCEPSNAGVSTPTYAVGRMITVGRFQCQILTAGVSCTVSATGKGFLFNFHTTSSVGGATVRPAPLHLTRFLSPDHRVWCGLGEGRGFCATGGLNPASNEPQSSATFGKEGQVTICSVPVPTASEGCIQNWDASAPVLQYGQQSELEGMLCTSNVDGITCTLVAGAEKGKGFRVSATEAVRVG